MTEKNFDTMKPMTRITYRVRLIDLKEELGYDVPIMSGIAGIDQLTYKEYEEGIMDRSSLPVFKRLSYLTGLSMDYLLGITDIPDAYKPGDGYMDFDISDRVRGCLTELCHVNQESRYLDQYGRSAIPLPGSQIIQPVIFSHGACKAGKNLRNIRRLSGTHHR